MPDSLPELHGYEMGLRVRAGRRDSLPAGTSTGAWALPRGEVAVLVGDVAGKGVETAALSAMTRFFIEARSWDCDSPAKVLAQANVMLRNRLPSDTFVTAFLGFLTGGVRALRQRGAPGPAPAPLRRRAAASPPAAGSRSGSTSGPLYEDSSVELRRRRPAHGLHGRAGGGAPGRRDVRHRPPAAGGGRGAARTEGRSSEVVELVLERVRSWADTLADDSVALALRRH